MKLQVSLPFDPRNETDFTVFPARAAVFALFFDEQPGSDSQPYVSYTRDLRRRLRRLLSAPQPSSRRLNLRNLTRRIEFQGVGSSFEAHWFLLLLNQFYYPSQFRRRLRLKPPALIKLNLRNRFPRCYPSHRLTRDGSLHYGPFQSRETAAHFAADFLDLFKIRRCVPDLNPDPAHPGCIYSQMKMCLAPCFKGCTEEEYRQEVGQVAAFLASEGAALLHSLEAERDRASAQLDFELAARVHRKLEKAREVIRLKPPLVRELSQLNAVLVLPGSEGKSVAFFRVVEGNLRGPTALSLRENVCSPASLDSQIHELLEPLGRSGAGESDRASDFGSLLPPWEHLSLLSRWYYSSFRAGEIVMLPPSQDLPHARLVRLCRKVVHGTTSGGAE